jgi:hypothetical protein
MTDKDVERNVRSTTVDGIKTPTERHVHGIGEGHTISFGEKHQARKTKQSLLERFRRRERGRQEKVVEGEGGDEPSKPAGSTGGGDTVE